MWPRGGAILGPKDIIWSKLGRGPLGDASLNSFENLKSFGVTSVTEPMTALSIFDLHCTSHILLYHFWTYPYVFAWVKVLNFQNPELSKLAECQLNIHNLKFKWSIVFRQTEYNSENLLLSPLFSILRLTFYGMSASKSWVQEYGEGP